MKLGTRHDFNNLNLSNGYMWSDSLIHECTHLHFFHKHLQHFGTLSQNDSCLKMFGSHFVRMCMNPKTFFWPTSSFCALHLGCESNVKVVAKGEKYHIVQKHHITIVE
jgi:hypothetical protein